MRLRDSILRDRFLADGAILKTVERKAAQPAAAPAAFLTVLAPYRGTTPPEIKASFIGNHEIGSEEIQVSVQAFNKQWRIGRNLATRSAWSVTE